MFWNWAPAVFSKTKIHTRFCCFVYGVLALATSPKEAVAAPLPKHLLFGWWSSPVQFLHTKSLKEQDMVCNDFWTWVQADICSVMSNIVLLPFKISIMVGVYVKVLCSLPLLKQNN